MGGGGASEVLPLQNFWVEKALAMLKGCKKCFEVVLKWELKVLAANGRGRKHFHPLKGVAQELYPVLKKGGGGGTEIEY